MENSNSIERKLDVLIDLIRQLVALELARNGVNRTDIGKRFHVGKETINGMLKGIAKDS